MHCVHCFITRLSTQFCANKQINKFWKRQSTLLRIVSNLRKKNKNEKNKNGIQKQLWRKSLSVGTMTLQNKVRKKYHGVS